MGTQFSFTVVDSSTPTSSLVVPANDAVASSPIDAFLGFGLVAPLTRDRAADFATARGIELVKSSIRRILGVRGASEVTQGELRWRTEFGSQLFRLRHSNNDDALIDIARVLVVDAITRWEPRVAIIRTEIYTTDTAIGQRSALVINVHFGVINKNVPGNRVFLAVDTVKVELPLAA